MQVFVPERPLVTLPTSVESCRQVIMAIIWVLNQLLAAVQPPAIRAMNQMTQYLFSASVMLAGRAFVLCCSADDPLLGRLSTWAVAAHLGIAELLKNGPKTAKQLAMDLGTYDRGNKRTGKETTQENDCLSLSAGSPRENDVYRLLRELVNIGFFEAAPAKAGEPVAFRNNALSATLRSDHPNCVRHMVYLRRGLDEHLLCRLMYPSAE